MSRWVEGRVISQKKWAPTLYSLYVQAPIEPFWAGQFTQIGLMVDGHILFRPYSFVNAPDSLTLEFYYTHLAKGELTNKLVHLQPNDILYVARKAAGRFTLEHVPEGGSLWLMATGTGLGVFLSLLQTKEIEQRFEKIILIHSVRQKDELTHRELIVDIEERFKKHFQYVPIVTREQVLGTLNERIPNLITKGQLEQFVGLELTSLSQIMLCGNPAMVTSVTSVLEARGLHLNQGKIKGNITVESYWKE